MGKAKKSYAHEKWLYDFAQESSNPLVQESEQRIQYFLQLEEHLPDQYEWRLLTSNVIAAEIKSLKVPSDANRIYWHDIGHRIEAYGTTVCWRATELMKPAIYSLNKHQIIAAAVLARSLLELASTFVFTSNNIEQNIGRALEGISRQGGTTLCTFDDRFDEFLNTAKYGTRLDIPGAPKSKNVLDMIRKASKISDFAELFSTYEFLCELAHPNVIGNACFWGLKETNIDGTETVVIGRDVESIGAPEVIEKVLWTLSWSASCIRLDYDDIRSTRKAIMERWPLTPIG